jgi:hypothetical protein
MWRRLADLDAEDDLSSGFGVPSTSMRSHAGTARTRTVEIGTSRTSCFAVVSPREDAGSRRGPQVLDHRSQVAIWFQLARPAASTRSE